MSDLGQKIEKRIDFLASKYNVYDAEELATMLEADKASGDESNVEFEVIEYTSTDSIVVERSSIAVLMTEVTKTVVDKMTGKERNRIKYKVMVNEDIFVNMIAADPTPNKMYLQWMLDVFSKMIKEGKNEDARRFSLEDLPQANEYLTLFDSNKRKNVFGELAETNYSLKGVQDPTNINQYKHLAQVFDAVDPFIEREPSTLEKAMKKFVDAGHAEIPVRDRNYTLFVPLTREANVVFDKFSDTSVYHS